MNKFKTLKEANECARTKSLEEKKTLYVIQSNECYYVDSDSFLRSWEKLIGTYILGVQEFND